MLNNKKISILAVILIVAMLLSACGSSDEEPTPDPNQVITQAVQTAMVALTQTALAEPSPTFTIAPTLEPSATFTPTVIIQTFTPGPSPTQPSNPQGPGLSSCDLASFVDDITIPDGTELAPGQTFTKTWQVKNEGTCTWTTDYEFLYFGGEIMSAEIGYALTSADIAPGETLDISIEMTAPAAEGSYTMYWIMRNAEGQNFGVDASGGAIYVQIVVSGSASSPTATSEPGNSAPVAADDSGSSYTVDSSGNLTVAAPGVLANDTDDDSGPDALTAILKSDPVCTSSTVILDPNGSFTYTYDSSQGVCTGSDTFTYAAFDGDAESAPATVTIAFP